MERLETTKRTTPPYQTLFGSLLVDYPAPIFLFILAPVSRIGLPTALPSDVVGFLQTLLGLTLGA